MSSSFQAGWLAYRLLLVTLPLGCTGASSDADPPGGDPVDGSLIPTGGDGGKGPGPAPTGGDGGKDPLPPALVDGGCVFTGAERHPHDSSPAPHVSAPLEASEYNSSPPSSGPHCNAWGQYAIYGASAPLPACNFLHNLEHGAVALLYNCPEGCPDLQRALEAVFADPPADPDCATPRLLVTPYMEMDARIAAAAWGHTWTSDCWDDGARASLVAFIEEQIGSRGTSPEPMVCAGGSIGP
jgi:hypothetical protein